MKAKIFEEIEFINGKEDLYNRAFPLRKKLIEYHAELNHDFQDDFRKKLNSIEKNSWDDPSYIDGRIIIATLKNQDCGYIYGVIEPQRGFVHSIYIQPDYRKLGIGRELMKRIILWFEEQKVKTIELDLCIGNESVLLFYSQLGFSPRKICLIRKNQK